MPRLVEDAGVPLSAGWLSRFERATGLDAGLDVGNREVEWVLTNDGVTVAHTPASHTAARHRYKLGLLYTDLPAGGLRWWWSCPGCRARVDALHLPADRERLACRKCCGLLYGSQYPGRNRRRRKPRLTTVVTREQAVWTPTTGWLVSRPRASR